MAEDLADAPQERESKLSLGALIAVWIGHVGLWTVALALVFAATKDSSVGLRVAATTVTIMSLTAIHKWLNQFFDQRPFVAGVYFAILGVVGIPTTALLGLAGLVVVAAALGLSPEGKNIQGPQASTYGINSANTTPDPLVTFEACVSEIFPEVYTQNVRRLTARGTSDDDAKEIATEKMLAVCRRHTKPGKGPIEDIPKYYTRAVSNENASIWRRRDRCSFADPSYDDVRSPNSNPEDEALLAELYREVMCQVTPKEKKILILTLQGYSGAEIAEIMAISRSDAAKTLQRMRERLRVHLKNYR
ncbi:MAG: sigma-70 family RNA polymerase sigma factor [bacterium]